MSWFKKVLSSSIGLKLAVALSGLSLVIFLAGHLFGNSWLYFAGGPAGLDKYAEHLHALPGFTLIEIGLLVMFLIHIPLVILLARSNRAARPSRYEVTASKRPTQKGLSLASRTMTVSGLLLLIFIILHVSQFRRDRHLYHAADGTVAGLGNAVVDTLSDPLFAVLYLVGSLLAAWHVFHGFQSAFRSFGLNHGKYTPGIEKLGAALAVVFGLGFGSIPIAIQAGLVSQDAAASAEHDDAAAEGADAEAPAEEGRAEH